jgi:hypothetical protein
MVTPPNQLFGLPGVTIANNTVGKIDAFNEHVMAVLSVAAWRRIVLLESTVLELYCTAMIPVDCTRQCNPLSIMIVMYTTVKACT